MSLGFDFLDVVLGGTLAVSDLTTLGAVCVGFSDVALGCVGGGGRCCMLCERGGGWWSECGLDWWTR